MLCVLYLPLQFTWASPFALCCMHITVLFINRQCYISAYGIAQCRALRLYSSLAVCTGIVLPGSLPACCGVTLQSLTRCVIYLFIYNCFAVSCTAHCLPGTPAGLGSSGVAHLRCVTFFNGKESNQRRPPSSGGALPHTAARLPLCNMHIYL